MKIRVAFAIAAFAALIAPAAAQDLSALAPADEYFGRYNLSVLGVANHIRDAGARIDAGGDPRAMINGPLTFATDALHDWEGKYPQDPWIAKDLLALESVYLRVPGPEGVRLAVQTETWLITDYPTTPSAAQGRAQLANVNTRQAPSYNNNAPPQAQAIPSYATPWERFAALRAPLPPR